MATKKWIAHTYPKIGGLGAYHTSQGARTRHKHLETIAGKDGWAVVSERLNLAANRASPKTAKSAKAKRIFRKDQKWAADHELRSEA